MKMKLMWLPVVAVLSSCSMNVPVKPEAQNIQVVENFVPTSECQLMGYVIAQTTSYKKTMDLPANNDEINAIKNEAVKLGANMVSLPSVGSAVYSQDTRQSFHKIVGTAYRCGY